MKILVTAMVAASALAMSAPAAAQYSNRYNDRADFSTSFDYRVDQLENRLDSGVRSGVFDRREARDLRWQLGELTRLESQYRRDGLSSREQQDLQQRMRALRQDLRMADNRNDGWYDRGDRYGSWDNDSGYYGRGGPYEDRDDDYSCQTRSGINGVIDSVFGSSRCLSVGQRASSNLYAVPYEYRGQYRDDSRYSYRSDGRQIYRIDNRTNIVAGVYPMNR
jgi:hypothetical protein